MFNLIILALPVLFCAFLAWQNHSLKSENELLNANLNIALNANESLNAELGRLSDDFSAGLSSLAKMKENTTKEVRYVKEIQTQILRDDNATCLGAINDIFARLHEQSSEHKAR